MTKSYFIMDDSDPPNIILNYPHMEAYIPEELFREDRETQTTIALTYGDAVRAIGLFIVKFFKDDDYIEKREKGEMFVYNYPNMITTYPSRQIKRKMSVLKDGDPDELWRILQYDKGDIIMTSQSKEDSGNCEKFLSTLIKGKIPSALPYNTILDAWELNFDINNVDPGVPSVALQLAIGQIYRSMDDPSKPFRKVAGLHPEMQTGYMAAGLKIATALTSVFSAMTYEDIGFMLTTGMNMSIENKEQIQSPVENVLSM